MMGAMPTTGRAEIRLPIGRRPRLQEGHPVDEEGGEQPGPAAHGPAGQHGAQEGLAEVGGEHEGAVGQRLRRSPRVPAAARAARRSLRPRLPTGRAARRRTAPAPAWPHAGGARGAPSPPRRGAPAGPPAPRASPAPRSAWTSRRTMAAADGDQHREQQPFASAPAHGAECRRARRWARPTRATSRPESSEAMTRAAQICTVWP